MLRGRNAKLDVTDNKLKTPLHWAAETGSVKAMEKMLEADRFLGLQVKDRDGRTCGGGPVFGRSESEDGSCRLF